MADISLKSGNLRAIKKSYLSPSQWPTFTGSTKVNRGENCSCDTSETRHRGRFTIPCTNSRLAFFFLDGGEHELRQCYRCKAKERGGGEDALERRKTSRRIAIVAGSYMHLAFSQSVRLHENSLKSNAVWIIHEVTNGKCYVFKLKRQIRQTD